MICFNKLLQALILSLVSLICIVTISADDKSMPIIGITQIIQHPSLDSARNGILYALQTHGYIDGKNIKIIEQNAQGSIANSSMIVQNFINNKVDVIVAISTPSAQSAVTASKRANIPVIFSTVSDPVAAGLVNSLEEYNTSKVVGSIDLPPIGKIIKVMNELLPNIKNVGVIYNNGEINSLTMVSLFKQNAPASWKVLEAVANNSSQISQAMYKLAGSVDAIYLPSDNVVFTGIPTIVQIANKHKIPVFTSEVEAVKLGCFASIGYTQYEVGKVAGELLVKTLKGVTALQISAPDKIEIFTNKNVAKHLDIVMPAVIDNNHVNFIE